MIKTFRKQYPFNIETPVEWGEMDAFQHVNNTVYFRYFERLRFAFLEHIGSIEWMKKTGIGPILASTQCRFRAALTHPDMILIGTCITDLQDDRFLMKYGIYSKKERCLAAEGDGLIVYFDYNLNEKTAIPKKIYRKLAQLVS